MAQTYVVVDANSSFWDESQNEFDYESSMEVQAGSPAEACSIARENGFDGLLFAGLKDLPVTELADGLLEGDEA